MKEAIFETVQNSNGNVLTTSEIFTAVAKVFPKTTKNSVYTRCAELVKEKRLNQVTPGHYVVQD